MKEMDKNKKRYFAYKGQISTKDGWGHNITGIYESDNATLDRDWETSLA